MEVSVNDFLNIVSFFVGLIGFGYAIYQGTEKRRLARFVRSQNWHLYSKANNANGALQLAINLYKIKHNADLSPEVMEMLSKADAFGQDVFRDIVRQIQLAEKNFDVPTIDGWVADGKVSEDHAKAIFKTIVVDE